MADMDISTLRFGVEVTGNPFMGAIPNNYHLKILLHDLITE